MPAALLFSVAIDKILFKLACNEGIHNILNEFEFQPDLTTDCGVSSLEHPKIFIMALGLAIVALWATCWFSYVGPHMVFF